MNICVKVANEIALTNSSLVESSSETDLDDDIVDDAVEIKSLTPPEDLSYLWAPKVTEVCVAPKSPEDASKSNTEKGESESITKEEDMNSYGQHEGTERNFPELADEFAAEGFSDLVANKHMSKGESENDLPEERMRKEVLQKDIEDLAEHQKEVTKDSDETPVPNNKENEKEAGEKAKPREDANHVPAKKNRGNWTDVVFPEDSSKSLARKTAESRKGPVEKVGPKEIANSQTQKTKSNWTDVVFKKDSNMTSETKMVGAKDRSQGEVERGKVEKSGLKEATSLRSTSEQKTKSNWTDVVFKKDSNTTKKVPTQAVANEIHEKTGSKGPASFQNTFEQSVLKATKNPPCLAEVPSKDVSKEVNEQKETENSEENVEDAKIETATVNGREDTEESEAEIEKRGVEEMGQMKEEGTGTEEEEEANGSWKIDFIRVETEAKETGKGKKAPGSNENVPKPRREKLSKRKKERRKERRKETQAVAAAVAGSLYEDNGIKPARRPITVDTTLVRKSQTSEKVADNEVRMTFSQQFPI